MDDTIHFGAVGRRGGDAVAPTFLKKDIYWGQRETPEYVTQHAVRARNFAGNFETARGMDEGEDYFSWMEEPLDVSLIPALPAEPELENTLKLEALEEAPVGDEFIIDDDEYQSIMAMEQVDDASLPLPLDESASLETIDDLLATPGLELPSEAEDIGSLIGELAEIYEDGVEVDKVDFSALEVIPEEVTGGVRIMSAEEFNSLGLAATFTEIPVVEHPDVLHTAVSEIFSTIDESAWMEISQPTSIASSSTAYEEPPTSVSSSACSSPEAAPKKPRKKTGRRKSDLNSEARKQRKREQNKEAAARYRSKRKETEAANMDVLNALLKRNKVLKQQVKKILSEVSSITQLARDVFQK